MAVTGWPGQTSTGDWWVFPETGTIQRQSNPLLRGALAASGWTGFSTQAEAKAFAAGNPASKIKQDVSSGLTGINAVGDFFHRITEPETWTRVGEVALGGILLYAGLRALTQGSGTVGSGARKAAVKPVRKVTRTAAKVAIPEARYAGRITAKRVAPKTTARVAAHRTQVKKYGGRRVRP